MLVVNSERKEMLIKIHGLIWYLRVVFYSCILSLVVSLLPLYRSMWENEGIYCEARKAVNPMVTVSHVPHRLNPKVHIEQLFKHCSDIKRSVSLENLLGA
jgi:hypothetical protein